MNLFDMGKEFVKHYFDEAYDPVKAHQYYEEHKKLTGRQSSNSDDYSTNRPSGTPTSEGKLKAISPEEAKAILDAEVAALKARLEALRELLRKLVEEAKRRSGVDEDEDEDTSDEDTSDDDTDSDEDTSDDELTPEEKAEKAKDAHDYYEETKDTTHVLKQKIALIEKKIAEIRGKLATLALGFSTEVERDGVPAKTKALSDGFATEVERYTVPVGVGTPYTKVRKGDSQNGS